MKQYLTTAFLLTVHGDAVSARHPGVPAGIQMEPVCRQVSSFTRALSVVRYTRTGETLSLYGRTPRDSYCTVVTAASSVPLRWVSAWKR